jgi:glycosyltransferase involved in cell wall biosynthesis
VADPIQRQRPLHIGIDGRELVGRPTGVGRYLSAVLKAWATDPAVPHRFTVFVPADPPSDLVALGGRVSWQVLPARSAGTWWEQTRLGRAANRAMPDVFFAVGYTAPLRLRCPLVVVIHDVSFFAHPEGFAVREGLRRRWLTRAAGRRARAVITVSEFSAGEIVRWIGLPRAAIHVAPSGPVVVPPPTNTIGRAPLALYVGSLFNRRRIPELLRAFALVVARVPNARLVLAGDNRTTPRIDPRALAAELGIGAAVEWKEYLTDPELDALYDAARVFVFLSDYEGFGLPPLEAIGHGAPPVVLDTAVAHEVYGDGAWFVAPDPPAIAGALTTLLTDDRAHAGLLAAGTRRLAHFSWPRTAATVLAVIERAAAGS